MATESKTTFLDLFIKVTKAVTASLDLDEVFDLITRKIPEILNVDAATIRLLDASGKKLVLRASHGLSQAYLNKDKPGYLLKLMNILQGMHYIEYSRKKASQEKYLRGWLNRVAV